MWVEVYRGNRKKDGKPIQCNQVRTTATQRRKKKNSGSGEERNAGPGAPEDGFEFVIVRRLEFSAVRGMAVGQPFNSLQ